MKKSHNPSILIIVMLVIAGCQPKLPTANPLSEIKVSETVVPLPTATIVATVTQPSVETSTQSSSLTQLSHIPISINNLTLLEPIKSLGNQNTLVARDFRTLLSPTFQIYAMAKNPETTDGPLIFTLRDTFTGSILHTLTGDAGIKFSSAFSPDGQFFAAGNDQGMLSVWDVVTGERILHGEIEKLPNLEYSRSISGITFSPDSKLVVTNSYNGRVYALWDLNLGRRIRAFYCHEGWACFPLIFSPDGKYIVTEIKGQIILLDGKTGSYIRVFAPSKWGATALAFSPTGNLLAVMNTKMAISIYQFPDGSLITTLIPDKADLDYYLNKGTAMSFSPDGQILATGYSNGTHILWNTESMRPSFVYQKAAPIAALTFSSDGTMLASESYDNLVTLWGIP